jgi:hypothetical protein
MYLARLTARGPLTDCLFHCACFLSEHRFTAAPTAPPPGPDKLVSAPIRESNGALLAGTAILVNVQRPMVLDVWSIF